MTDHTNDDGYNANIVHLADFATNAPMRFFDLKDQPPDILRTYGPFRNDLFEAAKEYPGTAITLIDRELSDSAHAIWNQQRVDGRKWLLVILDPIGGLRWRDPFYQIAGADQQRMILDYADFEDALWEIGDLQQEEGAKDMILIAARYPEEWFLADAAAERQEQVEAVDAILDGLADDMLEGRKSVAEVFEQLTIAKNDN